MRTPVACLLSVLVLLGPGLAGVARAQDRDRLSAARHRPGKPPRVVATIEGAISADIPLKSPVLVLSDRSGRPKYVFRPSEVSSTGRFRLDLKDGRLAKRGELLDFRATALGTLPGEKQLAALHAEVRGFDPERDELHINGVTTLISAYLAKHPRLSLEEATAKVERFLEIPAYVDPGDLSAGSWTFDHDRFLEEAARQGGLRRFVAHLVAEIDAGRQVHSFRSLTAPDLAALGNPLICVNTVAWDHGTSTSAAPYVQVGNGKYVRAIAGGIQAVVLTRQNLALVNNTAYSADASGISLLSSYLSTLSANDLVIVAGPQSTAMQVNSAVAKIGASMLLDEGGSPATSPGNYSVIGIPGLPYGQAWQSSHVLSGVTPSLPNCQGTSDGDRGSNLSGYFTLDSTGVNYTFLFADFIPFDTRVPGQPPLTNAMRFGDRTITTGPLEVFGATSIGGFHVVIIDRRTAEPWDPTFYMATTQRNLIQGTIEPDAAGIGAVEDTIHGVLTVPDSPQTGDGPNQSLYFFTSIGSPAVADTKLFSSVMAANLTAFGVNPHTFMSLTANDTWSLASYDVSDPSLPRPRAFESSSLITPDNPSGRLVGFLAKNRRNAWIPSVADQTGQLNYSLFPLALQPASPWPFANTPGYQSANAWIAGQLRLPTPSDVRLNYPNTNLDFGGTLFTELNLLAWPGSACGCSEDEFDELKAGLRQEFEWIDGVRTLFRNLKSPLDTSEVPEAVDIAAIASQIEQSISPPNTTAEAEVWLVLSGIATVTSFATGIPGLGLGVSAYKLAVDLANGLSGNSLDTVRTGAQQLGAQLAANVNTALGTFNQLQDIVVSDYGRLSQVGGNALTNPDWAWDGSTLNAAAELLTQSTNQVFWGSLMPLEYHVYKLLPGQNNNNQNITSASQYQCEGHDPETGMGQNVHTFQNAAASGQALFTADYVNDAAQRFVWVWYSSVNTLGHASMPPASLTDPLWRSVEDGGVGLYAPSFFWNWDPPNNLQCPPDKFD